MIVRLILQFLLNPFEFCFVGAKGILSYEFNFFRPFLECRLDGPMGPRGPMEPMSPVGPMGPMGALCPVWG